MEVKQTARDSKVVESETVIKDCINFLRNVSENQVPSPSGVSNNKKFSTMAPRLSKRSSIVTLFDPLHSVCSQNASCKNCSGVFADRIETITVLTESNHLDSCKESLNKKVPNVPSDNTLISFESPKKLAKPLIPKYLFPSSAESSKKYTEESFRQALKDQELNLSREFSKKFAEYEMRYTENELNLECELSKTVRVSKSYLAIISEMLKVVESKSRKNNDVEAKLKDLAEAEEKLKAGIETYKKHLSNVETSLSVLHKHYEQSKGMIRTYVENEKLIRKTTDTLKVALDDQNSKNDMLESRIQEVTDKAEKEIENAKKTPQTEITILEAQLKKAQMKVCSITNDLKQSRLENDKLGNIYDDLMSKLKA